MANELIINLGSGSLSDSGLTFIGDPITGALSNVGLKQAKNYFTDSVVSTGSYITDSSSFSSRINLISGSEAIYALTQSFNALSSSYSTDSASFYSNILNVYASESNYTTSSSFKTFSSSYVTDSSSFNTRINSSTGLVSSVSNADSTLTISPISGSVTASLNLTKANTWTGLQTFNNDSGLITKQITSNNSFTGGIIGENASGGVRWSIIHNENTGEIKYNAGGSYFPTFYSSNAEGMRIATSTNVLIGTTTDNIGKLQVGGKAYISSSIGIATTPTTSSFLNVGISPTSSIPASISASGAAGEIRFISGSSSFIYVCVNTNQWLRSSLTTF